MIEIPVISVIMPVYNGEKYIEQAIKSVLCQKVRLELIIVDDCSDDHTADVIKPFLELDEVIYLKNKKNQGVAVSRNTGCEKARGEYIAFLDADDWWAEDKLEKQIKRLSESGCVLCCTGRELMKEDGISTGKTIPVKNEITYNDLLFHNSINCSSVVVKTDIMKQYPMAYEDSHEDYITWMKLLKEYGNACGVNEPLLKYRLSAGSKSGNKLKSAKMTYKAYQYMGFGKLKSLCLFVSYAVHGIRKYM